MAENKNSFVLYSDQKELFEKLPDAEAGKLIKHIFKYVSDENPEIKENLLLEIAFESIKQSLKRDLKKYEAFRTKQSENGKLGGRPKGKKKSQKTQAFSGKPNESQKSLSVSVSDSVSESVSIIKKEKEKSNEFISWILAECQDVQKMDEPLTNSQADKLLADYPLAPLKEKLLALGNTPKYIRGKDRNKSANQTVRNWMRMAGFKRQTEMKKLSSYALEHWIKKVPTEQKRFIEKLIKQKNDQS